ncbi:flagellar export chaperone FlgN [Quadrisphaera oryzae]|uniref:flagellar export chaperone FlgN n=1 Tax=Quadrisphaera TaxID=317661 RepID=UPI00351C4DA9
MKDRTAVVQSAAMGGRVGVAEVSNVLWREREQLELLLFKLEEERLILLSGNTRWVAHASHEVQLLVEQLRETELLRSMEVDAYAASVGMPPSSSLKDLAVASDGPWASILTSHRDALLELTGEIARVSAHNREVLAINARATRETLLNLTGTLETYAPTGRTTSPAPAHLIDRAL